MQPIPLDANSAIRPVEALLESDQAGTLAVIVGVEGPSYRPIGAMMAVFPGKRRIGTLSSGCIERDIAIHADEARQHGAPRQVRYGRGSPFKDIQLPCGGGLDILLVPEPDREVLERLLEHHKSRSACTLGINSETGALELFLTGETGWDGGWFKLRIEPEISFLIFGKGPEASTFAALVQAAGFPCLVLSPDQETLAAAQSVGCEIRHMVAARFPVDLFPDARTAVLLFFHDHEWEPPILAAVLDSSAFYIGAQGSQRARQTREFELEALGVPRQKFARMKGPVGLIRSARNARTLAVSVLAEVLAELD